MLLLNHLPLCGVPCAEPGTQKCSTFVVSTACAGFALGSGETIDWQKMAWTAVGTFGAAGAANTLNQARLSPGSIHAVALRTDVVLSGF